MAKKVKKNKLKTHKGTVKVLNVMFDMLREKGVKTLDDIDEKLSGKADYKSLPTYHAII